MSIHRNAPRLLILIHGAWQGSWAWEAVTPLLGQAGFETLAVDLPGNGRDGRSPSQITFTDYVQHVGTIIDNHNGPVSLIGHSGGGMVASAVADRFPHQVDRIVYVAGMMLPSDVPYISLLREVYGDEVARVGIAPFLEFSKDGGTTSVSVEGARRIFYSDCGDELARALAARLVPQPQLARAATVSLTQEFTQVPRLYVEALDDLSIPVEMQRLMQAKSPGAKCVSLPTGHAPQASRPDLLVQSILPFLQQDIAQIGSHSPKLEVSA